ncbi:hypothetical protein F441_22900 [Phytophthora nicotianae CJ01A1]|uniref:Uncharacterized protein n=2 Tax=Phytophthora nicotianae TaxID=4792 RepID=W2VND9_PHYNI|nr:hypothetical protein F441_22900 [Phytophthora nicotianae CJ01A1]
MLKSLDLHVHQNLGLQPYSSVVERSLEKRERPPSSTVPLRATRSVTAVAIALHAKLERNDLLSLSGSSVQPPPKTLEQIFDIPIG